MGQTNATYLIPGLYPKSPIVIQDIAFTPRQWDILAAFYHLKKSQPAGTLLGITTDGVQAHIFNIKGKLPIKKKDLVHFLDTCHANVRNSLQRHYRYLLVEKAFQEVLKSLRVKGLTYQWNQEQNLPEEFPLAYINNHIELSGLAVSSKGEKPDVIFDYLPEFSDPDVYYVTCVTLLKNALPDEKHQSLLKEFLKQQGDILSGAPAPSETPTVDQKESISEAKWKDYLKTLLTAPEYNIYRYVGGVVLSLLITLVAGLILQSSPTGQHKQNITGNGNMAIQGHHNTVSAVQTHNIQKLEQHFHSPPITHKFQSVRSELMIPAKGALLKRFDS